MYTSAWISQPAADQYLRQSNIPYGYSDKRRKKKQRGRSSWWCDTGAVLSLFHLRWFPLFCRSSFCLGRSLLGLLLKVSHTPFWRSWLYTDTADSSSYCFCFGTCCTRRGFQKTRTEVFPLCQGIRVNFDMSFYFLWNGGRIFFQVFFDCQECHTMSQTFLDLNPIIKCQMLSLCFVHGSSPFKITHTKFYHKKSYQTNFHRNFHRGSYSGIYYEKDFVVELSMRNVC